MSNSTNQAANPAQKHGIEFRFGNDRKLAILSYAIFVNGTCQVDHDTTASLRKSGHDLKTLSDLEIKDGNLPIL